tara:strand:+ start:6602 stop:6910 length:309 start_codon:yes stop_codon:yes gene_type:complete
MEYLVSVLIWILACYGMTTIIVTSKLMLPLRDSLKRFSFLHKLVNCMLCMGFWVGVFWGALMWDPFSRADAIYPLRLLFDGCFGAATTWILYLKMYPLTYGK